MFEELRSRENLVSLTSGAGVRAHPITNEDHRSTLHLRLLDNFALADRPVTLAAFAGDWVMVSDGASRALGSLCCLYCDDGQRSVALTFKQRTDIELNTGGCDGETRANLPGRCDGFCKPCPEGGVMPDMGLHLRNRYMNLVETALLILAESDPPCAKVFNVPLVTALCEAIKEEASNVL